MATAFLSSIAATGDIDLLRWLRVTALHALFSTLSQLVWSVPFWFKLGLWKGLLAFLSASASLGYFLFLFDQLLFLASFRLVAEPEHSPGIKPREFLDLLSSPIWHAVLGAPKDQSKQDAEWRKLSTSAKRMAFLALMAACGAISALAIAILRLGTSTIDVPWIFGTGSILGLLYAVEFLLSQHYVLLFPPIQVRNNCSLQILEMLLRQIVVNCDLLRGHTLFEAVGECAEWALQLIGTLFIPLFGTTTISIPPAWLLASFFQNL
jgi:hypothetical protein